MAIRVPRIMNTKQIIRQSKLFGNQGTDHVPKGYFAVYVGESQRKRFVVPISFLNQPSFQKLLSIAEEELDSVILWAVSQFLAKKRSSLILLPACISSIVA